MDGKLRLLLEEQLDALSGRERSKLSQRAARDQREARARLRKLKGRRNLRGPGPKPNDPMREWMLAVLAREHAPMVTPRSSPDEQGRVIKLSRKHATVRSGQEDLRCVLANSLARTQRSSLAVGDRVTLGQRADERWEVNGVLPRRTTLSRPDPHDSEQQRVVVANVDRVIIVVSPRDPPLRTGLIDRMLVAVSRGGAASALVLNKADLVEDRAEIERLLAPYKELGVPVLWCAANQGDGLDALLEIMTGQTCVFVGHSGVGKSSLINALRPALDIEVGQVNEVVGKGRHTTTRSSLYQLGGGTDIIDTPGVRAFGIWRVEPLELRTYFTDLQQFEQRCRYADCLHDPEDECGVKEAVAAGELSQARFESYLRILKSLQRPWEG